MSSSSELPKSAPRASAPFALNLTQTEFDIQFFGEVLRRSKNHPDVLRRQAELLSEHGDYKTALELDRRLARQFPRDQVVQYNLACSYALNGRRAEAIAALRCALELGYADFARLESDPDLDSVRDDPTYRQLLRAYGCED